MAYIPIPVGLMCMVVIVFAHTMDGMTINNYYIKIENGNHTDMYQVLDLEYVAESA